MILFILSVPAAQAVAQQQEQAVQVAPDVTVAIGLKFWFNTWQSASGSYGPQEEVNVKTYVSDPNMAFIPSISLKYKSVFISTSYLGAPEYKFPTFTDTIYLSPTPTTTTTYTQKHDITATRNESDTNIGWFVTRNIALTLGYKIVTQEITDKRTGTGLTPQTIVDKPKYAGPTVGFLANVPVGERAALYGNLAFGKLDMTYQGGTNTTTYDADYVSTEVGFGFKDRKLPLSATVGYRFQSIEQKLPSYQIGGPGTPVSPDVTKGFIFGISLLF